MTKKQNLKVRYFVTLAKLLAFLLLCGFLIEAVFIAPYMNLPEEMPTPKPGTLPDPLVADLSDMLFRHSNNEIASINLDEITSFSWDRVYFFGPYSDLSDIDSSVGRDWRKVCYTEIDALEEYTLFVFTKNKKAVHCFEYPSNNYRFHRLESSSGILVQDAIFTFDDKGDLIFANSK